MSFRCFPPLGCKIELEAQFARSVGARARGARTPEADLPPPSPGQGGSRASHCIRSLMTLALSFRCVHRIVPWSSEIL